MFNVHSIDFEKIISIIKETSHLFSDTIAAAHITEKGAADYVTEVDTTVQKLLFEKLSVLYPDIQFMGEEKDNSDIDFSRPVWILDPVDGTTNLIHRFPASCISLGLVANGEPCAGIIFNPYYNELFFAVKGNGAFLNGKPIHVSTATSLSDCIVSVGTMPYRKDLTEQTFQRIKNVFLQAQDVRRLASSAIELCYIACGRQDAFFEPLLKPWDFAAGMVILEEAGGCVTDYEGNPVFPDKPAMLLASNGQVHQEMIEAIRI